MGKILYILPLVFICSYAGPLDLTLTKSASERIINGQNATNLQFPYAVSIQRISDVSNPGHGHTCGGVLITHRHVLTAASCTYSINYANKQVIPIIVSEFRVFAGSAFLSNDTLNDRVRNILNYTTHPQHLIEPSHANDLAVITLISPFPEAVVTPLALPPSDYVPTDFTVCTVAGWGARTNTSSMPSTQLQFINKYIYNQNLCASVFNDLEHVERILPTMVCTTSEDIVTGGCMGDQGSALVCGGVLTGISFLPNDCMSENNVRPEIYTRVSNYTKWIQSVTDSAPSVKPGFMALLILTVFHGIFQKVVS
ncbi:trypsin beta-like [Galleria mellonella]|uniref:Trypsin beta-like n=1 Tax=Galleria mellonella TaxID=7137 RepID=A0A6J1WSL3_GALME|nr:trypsin beta-like [Galleria mellonella]